MTVRQFNDSLAKLGVEEIRYRMVNLIQIFINAVMHVEDEN